MTDAKLDHLHPDLKPKALQSLRDWDAKYPDRKEVKITITWRSPSDQRTAWMNGKSNAKPGQSLHQFMLAGQPASKAFDYACFNEKGEYVSDGMHPYYKDFAILCKANGLKWGGDWSHGVKDGKPFDHRDYDHIELPT